MWPFPTALDPTPIIALAGREYDYIVVGGGTAGCAVASRLSEDANVSVLVIEKGPIQDSWQSRVPLLSCDLDVGSGPGIIHRYSEVEKGCNNRTLRLVNSESLGGSSRINGMIFTQGPPAMYDEWARIGHPNWSWAKVAPYWRKITGIRQSNGKGDDGTTGPVHTIQHSPVLEAYTYLERAAAILGLHAKRNANDPNSLLQGFFFLTHTISSVGQRLSAFHAYLPWSSVTSRLGRLTIYENAHVSRLDVHPDRGEVDGVFVRSKAPDSANEVFVRARREVILCGGAVCSPQLLQLSGIGPEALLKQYNIKVQKDLPGVGVGFADHQAVPICIEIPSRQTYHFLEKRPLYALWQLVLYVLNGSGWMKSSTTNSAIFLNTAQIDEDTASFRTIVDETLATTANSDQQNMPDVEIIGFPASGISEADSKSSLFTLYTCLLRPESTGSVSIRSSDPQADPSIRLNALSSPRDVKTLRTAVRFALRLAETFMHVSPWSSTLYLAPGGLGVGGVRGWRDLSDKEIDEFVRAQIKLVYHFSSSCRMSDVESGGVVNDELRVHGFHNLRVADASVFPSIPIVHTMAPTYMVAERCADFIKKAWREGGNRAGL